ncbi:glycosyltransferase [Erwinia amylovora]|uniref:Glycosyltransferase n=3 Tax=Erwinia amylovora TaxID=552 RepID=A0ABX7MHH8_ERWAM|nr:glycosyltransferase [Erwinia amylovora]EKV54936.1 putative glycosyl transferase [Erwinia amylovora ACW56400]CBA21317.1 putative glycosyl transferase [Erwinia amylovora CFBP1430]CCO79088.1 putative glycosyl transferase [Erwinia amylovora Ea356]CCO94221.1 putative glycosyl transferase [Erwinia amylovora NBRC 12687 = CFBP 1232]ATZ11947.1 glycosyl transferase [Erwinia amylovora]
MCKMRTVALIVTYNRLDKLMLCWASTARQSFDDIVIVNNASTDGTKLWLDAIVDPRLHRLHLSDNSGGAGGFKKGAQFIKDTISADWVFIYDDDAYPQDDIVECFDRLSEVNRYDAHAAKVIDLSNNICKMNAPWIKYPVSFKENIAYLREPHLYCVSGERREQIISFSFVGLIIKKDLLCNTTDYIHDDLFIYFDDVYYSYHLHLRGSRLNYLPEISFMHDINTNVKSINPGWKVYYLVRNLLLENKYFGSERPFSLCFICMRLIKYFTISVRQPSPLQYIKYFFKAIVDGRSLKSGRRH